VGVGTRAGLAFARSRSASARLAERLVELGGVHVRSAEMRALDPPAGVSEPANGGLRFGCSIKGQSVQSHAVRP
jgi:hypothetical protein